MFSTTGKSWKQEVGQACTRPRTQKLQKCNISPPGMLQFCIIEAGEALPGKTTANHRAVLEPSAAAPKNERFIRQTSMSRGLTTNYEKRTKTVKRLISKKPGKQLQHILINEYLRCFPSKSSMASQRHSAPERYSVTNVIRHFNVIPAKETVS